MLFYLVVYFFLLVKGQESDESFILTHEAIIKEISEKAEELYDSRCTYRSECLVQECTYEGCSEIMPAMQCAEEKYFSTLGRCLSCYPKGMKLSFDKSIIFFNDDISNMKATEKEVTCVFAKLDETFKKLWKLNGEKFLKWQYIGTYTGIHRSFPGKAWREDLCLTKGYDCRMRPWYTAAATGAKNIIIVLDTSSSMSQTVVEDKASLSRLMIAKEAVGFLLDTMTNADLCGFVQFNSNASYYTDVLLPVNSSTKTNIKNFINSLEAKGLTNYEDAFKKAFEILNNTYKNKIKGSNGLLSADCSTVILFLTDGKINEGERNLTNLLALLKIWDLEHNSTIISFTLGQSSDNQVPRIIACQHNGFWKNIANITKLKIELSSYYSFVSLGRKRTDVVWTEPYKDATSLGTIITAAMPVYDRSTGGLIGVAGIDISIEDLSKTNKNYSVFLSRLVERSQRCAKTVIDDCVLEEFRDEGSKCLAESKKCTNSSLKANRSQCTFYDTDFPRNQICNGNVTGKRFFTKINDTYYCCGANNCNQESLNNTSLALIIVGGFLSLTLFLTGVACFVIKRKMKRKKQARTSSGSLFKNETQEEMNKLH